MRKSISTVKAGIALALALGCALVLAAQLLVAVFGAPTMFGFWFPGRQLLAALAPLMDVAGEFEGYGTGTPSEFLRWLDVDVQRAVGILGGRRSRIPAIRGAA